MLNRYYDKIIFLTQAERIDRRSACISELKRVGIRAEPFFSIHAENPFQSFCLSQKAMIEELYQSGGERFLTLEDDVIFRDMSHISSAINELPNDWDILYLGANVTEERPAFYSRHLRRIRSAWTTHAIAYSAKAIEYIRRNYISWEENGMYDDWLSREFLPYHLCFVVTPMIAWQRPVYSDLWQRHVSYGWQHIERKLQI